MQNNYTFPDAMKIYEKAFNKNDWKDRRWLLSGKALNCGSFASVFKDSLVGFWCIAAKKTAGP
jgi:hypothetical protein